MIHIPTVTLVSFYKKLANRPRLSRRMECAAARIAKELQQRALRAMKEAA